MKIVTKAQTAITSGAAAVATAVTTASTTVTTELTTGVVTTTTAVATIATQIGDVVTQLGQLGAQIHPVAIAGQVAATLTTAQTDFGGVTTSLASLGQQVAIAGTNLAGTVSDVQTVVLALTGAPARLAMIRPDFSTVPTQLDSATRDVGAVMQRAMDARSTLTALATRLGSLHEGRSPTQVTPDPLALLAARAAVDGAKREIAAVKQGVAATASGAQKSLDAIGATISGMLDGATAQINGIVADVDSGVDAVIVRFDAALLMLDQAVAALVAQANMMKTTVQTVAAAVAIPLLAVEAAIAGAAQAVEAVGTIVDGILAAIEQQIVGVETAVAAIKKSIDDAVVAVDTSITTLSETLGDVMAQVDELETTLLGLPERFAPVAEQIGAATTVIAVIQAGVRAFIGQANGALDQTVIELDETKDRCDNAVAVCTKYIMRAPELAVARGLFISVKSMLPGIKATVAVARMTIGTAGNTAITLLGFATATVEALRSVLDEAIAELRAAIATVIELLDQVRITLQEGQASMARVSTQMHAAADVVKAQPDVLVGKVRNARDAFLTTTQPRKMVDTVRDEITALGPTCVVPVRLQIQTHETLVIQSIDDMCARVKAPAALLEAKAAALKTGVAALRDRAREPVSRLIALLSDIGGRLAAQIGSVHAVFDAQLAQADTLTDNFLQMAQQEFDAFGSVTDGGRIAAVDGLVSRARGASSAALAQVTAAVSATRAAPGDVATRMTQWQSNADSTLATAANSTHDIAAQVAASGSEFATLGHAAAASAPRLDAVATAAVLQAALTAAQASANASSARAAAAASPAQQNLLATTKELDAVVRDATTALAPPADAAADVETSANASLASAAAQADGLPAQAASASAHMLAAAARAQADVTARRDQGTALIDSARAPVVTATAQTDAARANVVSAEAVVAAAVARHGGRAATGQPNAAAGAATADHADPASPAARAEVAGGATAERAVAASAVAGAAAATPPSPTGGGGQNGPGPDEANEANEAKRPNKAAAPVGATRADAATAATASGESDGASKSVVHPKVDEQRSPGNTSEKHREETREEMTSRIGEKPATPRADIRDVAPHDVNVDVAARSASVDSTVNPDASDAAGVDGLDTDHRRMSPSLAHVEAAPAPDDASRDDRISVPPRASAAPGHAPTPPDGVRAPADASDSARDPHDTAHDTDGYGDGDSLEGTKVASGTRLPPLPPRGTPIDDATLADMAKSLLEKLQAAAGKTGTVE